MATKEARGTKRTCQNPECGSRFYDLNRDPIVCPICESEYRLAPAVIEEEVEEVVDAPAPVAATKAAIVGGADAGDGDEVTDDDALVSLEDADAELEGDAGDDEDDTFLAEDDDEGGDMTDIIGPVGDDDEES
jgi:uncharacterized protein (TIGR02300 family)